MKAKREIPQEWLEGPEEVNLPSSGALSPVNHIYVHHKHEREKMSPAQEIAGRIMLAYVSVFVIISLISGALMFL